MISADKPDTRAPGAFKGLCAQLLALVHVRAELMVLELNEHTERTRQKLLLALLATLFLGMALLLGALLMVLLFWDTHRLAAASAVTLLYLAIGTGALLRSAQLSQATPAPFASTRAEFAKDLAALRRQASHPSP